MRRSVHGWACGRGDFDALTGHLPGGYRVLAVDLAEHGESRSTREVWTMEEFARDVAAVLKAESVTTAAVAGHSLGAAAAVEVGRLLPGTVSHVVALDGLHYLPLFPAQSEEQTGALVGMFRDDFAAAVRGLAEEGSPAGTDPAVMDACVEKMVTVRQSAGLGAIEGLARWDMDAALHGTQQPVTVFAVGDLVTQEAIDRYGDRLAIVPVGLGSGGPRGHGEASGRREGLTRHRCGPWASPDAVRTAARRRSDQGNRRSADPTKSAAVPMTYLRATESHRRGTSS